MNHVYVKLKQVLQGLTLELKLQLDLANSNLSSINHVDLFKTLDLT